MQIHADFNNEASKVQQDDDGIMGTMDGIGYDRSERPAQGNDKDAHLPNATSLFRTVGSWKWDGIGWWRKLSRMSGVHGTKLCAISFASV